MKNTITRATQKILRDRAKNLRSMAKAIKAEADKIKAAEPVYEGRKNECIDEFFAELCCLTQRELKAVLPSLLKMRGYDNVIVEDGFIYAKGDIPVVLTAHMDTVHKSPVIDYYEKENENGNHILYSPQGIGGDDRCGIYMILRIIEQKKCSVIFCEDEEIGCVGSRKFCKTDYIEEVSNCNYMIGLDRAHGEDAVFYDCDNPEFTQFIVDNTGYLEEYGSYSDISYLAPTAGIAAVNLSCGYYKAHTTSEYVVLEEMYFTIDTVKALLDVECEQFEYIESLSKYDGWFSGYNWGNQNKVETSMGLIAYYIDENGKEDYVCGEGASELECWGQLFTDNPWFRYDDVVDYEFY